MEVLQADIFFFVTTISVVVLTIVLSIALVYVILILRAVKRLMGQIEEKAAEISEDIDDLRANVQEKARKVSQIVSIFSVAEVSKKILNFFQSTRKNQSTGENAKDSHEERETEDESKH